MRIIGLTGGIGTGKTTVANYLRLKGFEVLDLDLMSRDLVEPGENALMEIVNAFGPAALLEDGRMNRRYIGRLVFSDAAYKRVLDSIMQKYMDNWIFCRTDAFRKRSLEAGNDKDAEGFLQNTVLFMDAPLLFETHVINMVNEAWVVDVEDELRIQRIMKRDNMSRRDIMKRINAQTSREEKLRRADVIIDNSGTEEELFKNVDEALEDLKYRV